MNKHSPIRLAAPLALAIAPLMAGFAPDARAAFDFTGIGYVQYGDAQSYSLPIACVQVGEAFNKCRFNVDSTPGAIKDLVVLATGSEGGPVTTNFAGMDNAYSMPSGRSGSTFMQTGGLDLPAGGALEYPALDPDQVSAFTGDQADTWDTTIGALNTFLQGDAPVFFFNNNQVNSGASTNQNLAAWMQITVTKADGTLLATFDLTNNNGNYDLVSQGGGGTLNGDVGDYTSDGSGPDGNADNADPGTVINTDYVLSGGALCVIGSPPVPVPCGTPGASAPIDHNLGADHATYAIVFPELNALIAQLIADGNFTAVMHVDFRLGCDPILFTTEAQCVGRSLNNGYEQLFLARFKPTMDVASPGSLGLMASGLLGLGALLRRRPVRLRG